MDALIGGFIMVDEQRLVEQEALGPNLGGEFGQLLAGGYYERLGRRDPNIS